VNFPRHIGDPMTKRRRANGRANPQAMVVLRQFRLIYGSVRQHFQHIEKICGISGSQLWILQEVQKTPGVGVSELAERLSIHQSTCSQLVEKLVRRRLLRKARSSDDQRRVGLTIAKMGEKTVSSAPGPAQGLLPEALLGLSKAQLVSLERNLAKVIAELPIQDTKAAQRPLADL
jgi:DNA-binding MarR family transcriptional regulator